MGSGISHPFDVLSDAIIKMNETKQTLYIVNYRFKDNHMTIAKYRNKLKKTIESTKKTVEKLRVELSYESMCDIDDIIIDDGYNSISVQCHIDMAIDILNKTPTLLIPFV